MMQNFQRLMYSGLGAINAQKRSLKKLRERHANKSLFSLKRSLLTSTGHYDMEL